MRRRTNYQGDITNKFGHIIRKFEEQRTLANLTIEVPEVIYESAFESVLSYWKERGNGGQFVQKR